MYIAAIDGDMLVPLVVGVFWVIAQIAGGAAKKKAAPPPRPAHINDENEQVVEDPFADLMRKLGGVQEFQIPEPPQPKEVKAESPWTPGDIEALPDMHSAQRTTPTPVAVEVDDIAEVNIRPTMNAFRTTMPSFKLPAMNLNFQTSEKSTGKVPRLGKIINPADKQSIRRAILGQIILSPPKAMGG